MNAYADDTLYEYSALHGLECWLRRFIRAYQITAVFLGLAFITTVCLALAWLFCANEKLTFCWWTTFLAVGICGIIADNINAVSLADIAITALIQITLYLLAITSAHTLATITRPQQTYFAARPFTAKKGAQP
ncbi:hypothetical protein [Cardiobacterium sp. Marseille-Q4385]|uniref:hypothetical protein n=1 Tax=Cardiobacterium sp. Marseille-Q4385 TaxID=2866573 RepID=UPI001CE3EF7F|nr:hypothetical protein [Cardiobacterium sp. Marseille-Q4385]